MLIMILGIISETLFVRNSLLLNAKPLKHVRRAKLASSFPVEPKSLNPKVHFAEFCTLMYSRFQLNFKRLTTRAQRPAH